MWREELNELNQRPGWTEELQHRRGWRESLPWNEMQQRSEHLKATNTKLTKALVDLKSKYTQMVEEKTLMQRELLRMHLFCTELVHYNETLESVSEACLSSIEMASDAKQRLQNARNTFRAKIGNNEISDPPSDANNSLPDTVQEEQEDELSRESRLNSLANASSNSLNLAGGGSQVPLLSGVVRDVRVWLSPIKNIAQYLDPCQHVTTERESSKAHRPKGSHSMHSMRSTETRPKNSSSSAENRRPSAATNSAQNEPNSSASVADSFSAFLENSPLSSTKTIAPKLTSRTDNLNWIGDSNTRNSPRIETFAKSSNGLNSNYGMVKRRQSQKRLLTTVEVDEESDSEPEEVTPKPKRRKKAVASTSAYERMDFSCDKENKLGEKPNVVVATWNVGGIRAWTKKEGHKYLLFEKPDIFCIQEAKCSADKLPSEVTDLEGYHKYWANSSKEGYVGVGLFTRTEPVSVEYGIGVPEHDEDGRCITAEFEKFYVVTVNVPYSGKL